MSLLRRIACLLFALTLSLSVLPAFAQDDGESDDPLDDPSQLEGIQYGVLRMWSVDYAALMAVTPEDEDEDVFASIEGPLYVGGMIIEFDGDDDAEAAYDLYASLDAEYFVEDTDEDPSSVDIFDIDDLGDDAFGIKFDAQTDTSSGPSAFTVAREDNYLVITISSANSIDDTGIEQELAEAIVDNLDDQSGLGDVVEDGTSSGGLWDAFPDDDDDMFGDLIAGGDSVIYPEEEGAS